MRFAPKSLFGRLVLVLLAGLVLSQLATLYINQTERDQLLYRAGGMRLAQQISDIVKLLESLPGPERRRVVAVFNRPPLAVTLDRPALDLRSEEEDADFQLSIFTSVLRYALGEDAKIEVGRTHRPSHEHGERGFGPRRGRFGPPAFTVQVPLHDGTLVTFDSSVLPPVGTTTLRLALTLAVLLATVIVISLVAVRWVTGPLTVLADAAERLGENINRPPIPEAGPAEVQRAARSFNAMQQRLSRSIAERSRVLTAMSHDLKTPITRMRLRTDMLEDDAVREKFDRDLAEMEQMVTQTLEFMRDATDTEPVQRVDLMALLESLQADYEDMGKEVRIAGRVSRPLGARPVALRRCVTNLVDNAIRYGARATIDVAEEADRVTLRVLDEGPGIPEAKIERAFEPFFRGEASRSRETGGFGLGLGIARNIARAHGGELTLRNRPEGGLAAILTLPHPA
ncbi:MAG TPA: ATP-binding protein [Burkholderiales bacterium]|jgi:signal transduction histidine kinase|nr:ATP-binding protein [Burkholderiales bacterium]